MSIALVLAGHGSHINPNTSGIVWEYVDTLRQWAVADEITACFWKEQPHFNQVLDTLNSDTIVVVPVFTAAGYFSQQVVPAEMGLSGTLTQQNSREIHYTRTMGEHPMLQHIVSDKIEAILREVDTASKNVAVAIIGHGTNQSSSTRRTTEAQVRALKEAAIVPEVVSAYLDDDPSIPSIYERTTATTIIAVPFFLAAGSHATQDVPDALGIQYGKYPATVQGRTVYYADPIGTDEAICQIILQLANETGFKFEQRTQPRVWSGFPAAGAAMLQDKLAAEGELTFGELRLSSDSVQPINSTRQFHYDNPASLRQHIREKPFRPLATSYGLDPDWIVHTAMPDDIPAIVETVYPGAVSEWARYQTHTYAAETLETVVTRQQGKFSDLDFEDHIMIGHFVSRVCGRCIKEPIWHESSHRQDAIPCATPCNIWLTKFSEEN